LGLGVLALNPNSMETETVGRKMDSPLAVEASIFIMRPCSILN
jgi:hypothetical protein